MRTTTRASKISASLVLGATLAAGCGDDSDSGGDVTTGIAPNKLLSEVTTEEAAQACESLSAGFESVVTRERLVRTICTLAAAVATDNVNDCNRQRELCLEEANDPNSETAMAINMQPLEFECGNGAVLTECTATVGELETCFNHTLERLEVVLDAVSCDQAASIGEDGVDQFAENAFGAQPPSCETVDCGENSPFGPGDEE